MSTLPGISIQPQPLQRSVADVELPRKNRILRCMRPQDFEFVLPQLTLVNWPRGEVVHETCMQQRFAYFPVDAIVSTVLLLEDGHSCEIALVGNDDMLGMSIFTQTQSMPGYSMVQVAGSAYQLRACVLRDLVNRSDAFRGLLLRYTQVMITQIAQSVTCNRYHTIHQQLARWLLIATDHLPGTDIRLTQEQIAHSLGVRREGVTEAAGRLQKAGIIEYRRGRINVLDRPALERACCECYRAVKRETERLLPE